LEAPFLVFLWPGRVVLRKSSERMLVNLPFLYTEVKEEIEVREGLRCINQD
jgi:hypothetical protein